MEVFPGCEIHVGDIITAQDPLATSILTSGRWNHAAIVCGYKDRFCVVEVQSRFPEVVAFTPRAFLRRYQRVRVGWCYYGPEMASVAIRHVGSVINYTLDQPVQFKITPIIRDENAVSFLRRCSFNVVPADPGWQVPDDVAETTFLRWEWFDERWIPPVHRWSGRIHKLQT